MTEPGLGCRLTHGQIKDKIPKKYLATKRPSTGIETRYWNLPASMLRDQGGTSSCVGHGWFHNALCGPKRITPNASPFKIYNRAQQLDPWKGEEPAYEGTTVEAGALAARELGLVKEFHWAFDADTAINWLLTRGPLVLGTIWPSSMAQPHSKTGIVDIGGRDDGMGHCYLATGVNRRTGLVKCANSWGLRWGLNGSFWLRIPDFARLISEQGEVAMAAEL